MDKIYPVGSIYLTLNKAFNPAKVFGGEWERLKDRFLLGAGDTYTAGATGGEANHVLTESEMPKHSHKIVFRQSDTEVILGGVNYAEYVTGSSYYSPATTEVGGSQAHNNMPPYIAVYMWKRIA